jgi:hypothetical protein
MTTMHHATESVKSFTIEEASVLLGLLERQLADAEPWASWPDWTDSWHYTADPLPGDAIWAAAEFADDDEDLDEHAALEMAATDAMGLGLIPPDCGFEPNTADGILHRGSDRSVCPCYDCVEFRTRRFAADF